MPETAIRRAIITKPIMPPRRTIRQDPSHCTMRCSQARTAACSISPARCSIGPKLARLLANHRKPPEPASSASEVS